jgi:hypothetical protein
VSRLLPEHRSEACSSLRPTEWTVLGLTGLRVTFPQVPSYQGVGRGTEVGRLLGVGVTLGVAIGVGVADGVSVGVVVGVGVDVGPNCAQYLAPLRKKLL